MNKKSIIAVSLVMIALVSAFFILKPETKPTSDGHTDHTHETSTGHASVQDESQPHTHDE